MRKIAGGFVILMAIVFSMPGYGQSSAMVSCDIFKFNSSFGRFNFCNAELGSVFLLKESNKKMFDQIKIIKYSERNPYNQTILPKVSDHTQISVDTKLVVTATGTLPRGITTADISTKLLNKILLILDNYSVEDYVDVSSFKITKQDYNTLKNNKGDNDFLVVVKQCIRARNFSLQLESDDVLIINGNILKIGNYSISISFDRNSSINTRNPAKPVLVMFQVVDLVENKDDYFLVPNYEKTVDVSFYEYRSAIQD